MLSEIAQEELASALDRVATSALLATGSDAPPVDPAALARALGFQVIVDHAQSQRARFVRLRDFGEEQSRGFIFIRPDPRAERMHWAVAHELGEALTAEVFAALTIDPAEAPSGAREKVANLLAGRILVPSVWFSEDARGCDWDLPALKRRYGTASHELIARRMLDFADGVIITVFDHDRKTFRRGNLPWRCPALTPAEQACQQQVHSLAAPVSSFDGQRRIQGWPVHEPDWKREILRMECEDVADA